MLVKAMANKFGEEKGNSRYFIDCFRKVRLSKPPKLLACQTGKMYLMDTKIG